MQSWLQWRKDLFNKKPDTPDHFIDADGVFYCAHECCTTIEEHLERKTVRKSEGDDSRS